MTICKNCGVELDEQFKVCPLCGKDPHEEKNDSTGDQNTPRDIVEMHRKENRKHLWELSGIILLSAICVCTVVDLIVGPGLKWSLFADTSCLAAWIFISLLHFKKPGTSVRILAAMFTVILLLFLFSLFSSRTGWYFPLALPVILSAFLCLGIILLFREKMNFMGFNLLGVSFFAIAIFCVLTEATVDYHRAGEIRLHWSLITASSIIPLSAIFFFMHYRLKRGNRLDSFFHV